MKEYPASMKFIRVNKYAVARQNNSKLPIIAYTTYPIGPVVWKPSEWLIEEGTMVFRLPDREFKQLYMPYVDADRDEADCENDTNNC